MKNNPHTQGKKWMPPTWALAASVLVGLLISFLIFGQQSQVLAAGPGTQIYLPLVSKNALSNNYVLLGWNDLGMHCYNRDFSNLGVLPPFNNLYAQVIKRGDPPKIVTSGLNIQYAFPQNTYSVGKSNFWSYAKKLFSLPSDLPNNIGLTGRGLSGSMSSETGFFVAEGIPLTEYNDNDWNTRQPYQLASLTVTDTHGTVLASNQVVAPVSTEMRCDRCHSDGQQEGIATGSVETNILTLHDQENQSDYPAGHTGALMGRRPVLCAECHTSNALVPLGINGVASLPNFSKAMHSKHAGKVSDDTAGCYNCHPGPTTLCLRDVMSSQHNMGCVDCHGTIDKVKNNPSPWLNEPRCDTCHDKAKYGQDNALYRNSKGHGGLYCEACHDSTHAIAPSTQPNDAIKFINLQGQSGTLRKCTVCHITQPTSGGPHS